MWLKLDYNLLKKWKPIVFTTFFLELIYQAMVYLHPENLDWVQSDYFSIANTLQFILLDQFLIECISVAIIFQLIRIYAGIIRLDELRLGVKEIILYELKFLPILLVSFFFFAPFTLTVRFLYHMLPDPNWDIYFSDYFYSFKLYFNYLTPVLLVGYTIINVNLIYQYNLQLGETKRDLDKSKKTKVKGRLWASDDFGELFLDVEKILWIEREDRKSFAKTDTDRYRLKENITELEEKLDPNKFIRISRSVIVNLEYVNNYSFTYSKFTITLLLILMNLEYVNNYSFWENDKYVVRMKENDKEFVMSRERLNKVKGLFLKEELVS